MNDSRKQSGHKLDSATSTKDSKLVELRRLILGPDEVRLAKLQDRIEDREVRTQDVSEVLTEAFTRRESRDQSLSKVLTPSFEEVIRTSVRRNPKILADALFPVIGPAIRKAISDSLSRMIQTLNEGLEHSFSPTGLRWRFESWRTGKPFGEVVLLRTIQYRVEQVFLIHRESGLLIDHVAIEAVAAENPDLVSGMFTAVRDFMQDSFHAAEYATLGTLQFGDLTIWGEQGPHAMMAAVVRGTPAQELRDVLQDALEGVHIAFSRELAAYDGTPDEELATRPFLLDCLLQKRHPRRKPVLVWGVLATLLLVALAAGAFFLYRNLDANRRLARYVEALNQEPGIVVTTSDRKGSRFQVAGLRDPLASDPSRLAERMNIPVGSLDSTWKSYFASDSYFIERRAGIILRPPSSVSIAFSDGALHLEGRASAEWIAQAKRLAVLIPGVQELRVDDLREQRGPLLQLKEKIEGVKFYFRANSKEIAPAESGKLLQVSEDLKTLIAEAVRIGQDIHIEILGRADRVGTAAYNRQLSRERAQTIRLRLISLGIEADRLTARGLGSDISMERSVSFGIVLPDDSETTVGR